MKSSTTVPPITKSLKFKELRAYTSLLGIPQKIEFIYNRHNGGNVAEVHHIIFRYGDRSIELDLRRNRSSIAFGYEVMEKITKLPDTGNVEEFEKFLENLWKRYIASGFYSIRTNLEL